MPTRVNVALDVVDLEASEAFWRAALGYVRRGSDGQYVALCPPDGGAGVHLLLQRVDDPTPGKNRMHLDIDVADVEAEVARLVGLGATVLSEKPFEELGHRWVVMADPEGNELCICQE